MKHMTLFLKTTFSLILILLSCSYSFTQSSANLDWVSTFGDVGSDWGYQVSTDTKGNIIVMGRFTGSIDLDRGVDTFMLRNTLGTQGLFICKMDYTGKPIWAQQLENNTAPPYNENILTTDTLGNVYFTGSFSTPMDVDPGPTTLMFNPLGFVDAFTIKLDKDGTFQWASQLGGNGARIEKNSISVDASGNVFLSGGLRGTADFDPGPGVNMQSSVAYDLALFVQKLDTHGNLLWVNLFKNKNTVNPHSAGTDSEGNFLLTSAFFDTLDVDPGPSVRTLISTGLSDIFLLKLDPRGNFSWVQQISGTSGGPTKASFGIDASNNI